MFKVLIVIKLLMLHGSVGQEIDVNPDEIVTLREPRVDEGHLPRGTRCIVNMSDGKFNAVREECSTVRDMIEEIGK